MTGRRRVLLGVGATLLAGARRAAAERVFVVGFLAPGRRPDIVEALKGGLRDRGYVEGRNLRWEYRCADGDYALLDGMAAELVRLPVDLLVVDATPAALAAMKATREIPIVFNVGDPVGAGLIPNLARPGGNATGMSVLTMDLGLKHLELITGIVDPLTRLAVLHNPSNPNHLRHVEVVRKAAAGHGIWVIAVGARSASEIRSAFARMVQERAGALLWFADPLLNEQLAATAALALEHRLPSIAGNPRYAEAGGLMTYGASPEGNFRHLAGLVDKILKGARPGDLPVEQPTKIDMVLNRRTARRLGIEFLPELMVLADRVID
jgi:putative ABC transport system substrate-binding protein